MMTRTRQVYLSLVQFAVDFSWNGDIHFEHFYMAYTSWIANVPMAWLCMCYQAAASPASLDDAVRRVHDESNDLALKITTAGKKPEDKVDLLKSLFTV